MEASETIVKVWPEAAQAPPARPSRAEALSLPVALCVLSLGAAAIHFAVMGDHFNEFFAFGLFFAIVAWLQALWAVAIVVSPARRLVVGGLLGNLAIVALWAVSRTAGLPIGPHPWQPEAAALIDVVSTGMEVLIAVGCALLLVSGQSRRGPGGRVAAIIAIVVALIAIPLTTAAMVPHDRTANSHDHGAAGMGRGR